MKNPNGFGNVSKLPGNRRNPWRVRKTCGWEWIDAETKKTVSEPTSKQIAESKVKRVQKHINIGYFPTRQAALQALAGYNVNPFNISPSITFSEVYDKWSKKKFETISRSNENGYQAAYKLCGTLYSMKFADIKLAHLQGVVDTSGKAYPTLKKLKILFNQLFDYAVQNDIISKDKHIVEYVYIGKAVKSEKHYRFTNSEIETMWRWANNNQYIQLMLMLIYSGVRPGELFAVKKSDVNLEESSFWIQKGKNDNAIRKVPIHYKTAPFFKSWMQNEGEYLITQLNGKPFQFSTNHSQYTESYWRPLLTDMGILQYTNEKGEIKEHTPDDTRHTFTTMWKEKRLDEAMRRKIQGHSGKGIGEMVYTHFEFQLLKNELDKL